MIISFTPLRGPTRFFDINKEQEVIKDNTPAPIKTTVIKAVCDKFICKHLTKPPKKLKQIAVSHKNLAGVLAYIQKHYMPTLQIPKIGSGRTMYNAVIKTIARDYTVYALDKGVIVQRKFNK